MSEEIDKKDNENDELTCPITFQLFRDPVRASDGRVYEREAITRWILLHGTSPYTRQPLQINDLVPDHNLKALADKRRGSVSYNASNEQVIFPPIQHISNNNINYPTVYQPYRNVHPTNYTNKILIISISLSVIIPISFILGIILGLKTSYPKVPEITSTYANSITNNSFYSFMRAGQIFYYKTVQFNITTDGFYGFEIQGKNAISMDGDLYLNYFDNTNLNENILNYAYKDKTYTKTLLGNSIQSQQYVLMITTYFCCDQGTFSVLVTGPANIFFS